jgi:hypothetical protein
LLLSLPVFVKPHRNSVISTEAAHSLIVSSVAEKPASLHTPFPSQTLVFAVAGYPSFAVVVLLVIPEGDLLLSHRLLRSREIPHFALFALIRLYPFDHRYAFIRVHPRPSAVALLWPLKVLTELGTDFCHYAKNGSIRLTTLATLSTTC